MCHRCTATFTTPNPLKLHLFFQQCTGTSSAVNTSTAAYTVQRQQQSNTLPALWSRVLQTLTMSNITSNGNNRITMPSLLNLHPSHQSSILHHSHNFLTPFIGNHHRISTPTGSNITSRHPAAQVETLVSHLGRSKHGHVCIYCGKIYSRKYGLKIHIR